MSTDTEGSRGPETTTAGQVLEPRQDKPLELTHKEMDTLRDRGQARPLAVGVAWIARYRGAWWIAYERRWLRVTDSSLTADLDATAKRLEATESAEARYSVLCRSLMLIAAPGELDDTDEKP